MGQEAPDLNPVTNGIQQLVTAIKAKQEEIRLAQEALTQRKDELVALMEQKKQLAEMLNL
jgi:hypothetical protein